MRLAAFLFPLVACLGPGVLHAQATTPAASTPFAAASLAPAGAPATVDLRNHFNLPTVTGTIVQLTTVMGRFNFELFADTPITTANFLRYVNGGSYDNTIVHRSVPGFVIQGGGYTYSINATHIPVSAPITNEFRRANTRGTVAMAKLGGDPNSATSEWFVNLADNRANLDSQNGGFTVFARVLGNGMSIVDAIAALQTANINFSASISLQDVPVRNITPGQTQLQLQNLVAVNRAAVIPVYPSASTTEAVLSFSTSTSNAAVVTAAVSDSTLTLTPGAAGTATVTVTATDTHGAAVSQTVTVTVGGSTGPNAPVITAQPQSQLRLASGTVNTVVFSVSATGSAPLTYQWRRNDIPVTGQVSSTYVLTNASDAQAGTFTCIVSNGAGSAISRPAVLSFTPATAAEAGRLINLSILSSFAAGETMTMGTVLGGADTSGTKAVLARAAGPALSQLGVADVLPDPQMSLVPPGATTALATNNDWAGTSSLSNAFAQVGAFAYAAADSKDAAIYQPALAPGAYTVQVSDAGGRAGVGIAELYDSTPSGAVTAATPRLINVSVLKQIPSGASLTAGFVIGGTTAKTVLVRAVGPTLAAFGVTETMADPQLTLFDGTGTIIADNDNWGGDTGLTAASDAVGAFRLASASSGDAVLLITLPPGSYTARVGGANGGAGAALVEVYEVP